VPESVPQAVKSPPASIRQIVIGDEEIFDAHAAGKLSVELKAPLDTQRALSIAYTPGVAQVSRAIAADRTLAARYA
jgi:malate dehydrogenase (oxaloacetate-decarboxylating)